MVARFSQDLLRGLAVAALAVAIVAGSVVLWIGIPLAGLWLAGELTRTPQAFLLVALGGVPPAMAAFGFVLYRLSDVYERLRGGGSDATRGRPAWLGSLSDERVRLKRARAPRPLIDVAMTASAVTALVLLFVWFFFLGEMRLAPLP